MVIYMRDNVMSRLVRYIKKGNRKGCLSCLSCCFLLIIPFFSAIQNLGAQDVQFSQFYASPLYLNPAFTGNTVQGRAVGNYRNQWSKIPGAYITYAFSYDHFYSDWKSGFGILAVQDRSGIGYLTSSSLGAAYSYQLSITRKHHIRAGMRFAYILKSVDYSRLSFGDQLVRNDGSNTVEPFLDNRTAYPDVASGIAVFSEDYWFGFAADHMNQPNESMTGIKSRLPLKLNMHGGYNIPLKDGDNIWSTITLAANYKMQDKWDQFDVGAYFQLQPIVTGLWYRGIPLFKSYQRGYVNHESFIFMLGYRTPGDPKKWMQHFSTAYSYDFTISKLISNTGGSHEISVIYEFSNPNKKKRKRTIVPCAKF